jgi:hypothetical protein
VPAGHFSNLFSLQYKTGRPGLSQTASHAFDQSANLPPSAIDAPQDISLPLQQQSSYPSHSPPTAIFPADESSPPLVSHHARRPSAGRTLQAAKRGTGPYNDLGLLQSPLYIRPPASARLWNPTNSTPRSPPPRSPPRRVTRTRRSSTPSPPPVPLKHPAINITSVADDPPTTSAGNRPLLPVSEQRFNLNSSISSRASRQIESRASGDYRINLPKTVRHSYDSKRGSPVPPPQESEAGPSSPPPANPRSRASSFKKRSRAVSFGLVRPDSNRQAPTKLSKGKGKAIMTAENMEPMPRGLDGDLERGPDVLDPRHSFGNLSLPDGLPSPVSSDDSSILGDPDQPDYGEAWGPQHPCFPHFNPHVPVNSPEYSSTRIIRVRRDWLVEGDLAPTFSNLYPEILDPAGVSEHEFRRVIEKLNAELVPIFSPYNWKNIFDGVVGLFTGWIWDDLGLTNTKSRLRNLEAWIEKWNIEMEKTVGSEEGVIPPRIIPLRRTGYMNVSTPCLDLLVG